MKILSAIALGIVVLALVALALTHKKHPFTPKPSSAAHFEAPSVPGHLDACPFCGMQTPPVATPAPSHPPHRPPPDTTPPDPVPPNTIGTAQAQDINPFTMPPDLPPGWKPHPSNEPPDENMKNLMRLKEAADKAAQNH